jgi:hypothetical protein
MPALLGSSAAFDSASLKRPAVVFSCLVVALLYTLFAQSLHLLHANSHHHVTVALIPVFPILFLAVTVVSLPLLVFISYEKDFPAPFNPLLRFKDFQLLAKRTFNAINKGKITAKDL